MRYSILHLYAPLVPSTGEHTDMTGGAEPLGLE